MKQPHVRALSNDLLTEPPHPFIDFSQAPAKQFQLDGFDCLIEARMLTAKPTPHFEDAETARLAIDPQLRAWETRLEIDEAIRATFRYRGADIVDLDPSTDPNVIYGSAVIATDTATLHATASVSRHYQEYPSPATVPFVSTPTVLAVLGYLREWREGRSRLLAAAYLIYGRLARDFDPGSGRGRDQRAAAAMNVDGRVFSKLGTLAARNDPIHGRKESQNPNPLTPAEIAWVEAATKLLVARAGEVAVSSSRALPPLPLITLAQLPHI